MVEISKVPRYDDAHACCRLGCHTLVAVSLFLLRVKAGIDMPKAPQCRGRARTDVARRTVDARDRHNRATLAGGARGSCPRSKVSMMIMAAPQSGQT